MSEAWAPVSPLSAAHRNAASAITGEREHARTDGRGAERVTGHHIAPVSNERPVDDVAALAEELARKRAVEAEHRADELARAQAEAEHARARADVATAARLAEMARAEREAEARAVAEHDRLLRETRTAGERSRIATVVARSGDARALKLERTRTLNMRVLVPTLCGFGAWSTAGVQQGGARLMNVTTADPIWWALWLLEPVLIGVVVWVIVARARLTTTGGTLARGAERIATAALGTSIALNLVAALPHEPLTDGANGVTAVIGSMLAHAIGPIGAAATAYLIGVIDASVTAADPWAGTDHPTPKPSTLTPAEPARASSTTTATNMTKSVTNTTPTPSLESAPKVDGSRVVEAGAATTEATARPANTGRSEVSDKITEPDADLAAWVQQESEAGRSVTGTTVAAYLGVSPATGRRRLAAIKQTDDTPT